jgi:uncharacterized protein (DUF3084 family)
LPNKNNQDQNPAGEGLEALLAQKDEELTFKDARIAELEQAVASRDNQVAALKQSLAELEGRLSELESRLSQALSAYRAQAVKSNPAVPEELVSGDSIETIDKAVEDAQNLIAKVKRELEAEIAGARVPAGAPQRGLVDLSVLSPREKIQYAIGERR